MSFVTEYYSLQDFRIGRHPLYPKHLEMLKQQLLSCVRAEWKKKRIRELTPEKILSLPNHWCFSRICYLRDPNSTHWGGYIAGQDYRFEMRQVVDVFVGRD